VAFEVRPVPAAAARRFLLLDLLAHFEMRTLAIVAAAAAFVARLLALLVSLGSVVVVTVVVMRLCNRG
jgi:hypothetical protein